LLDYTTLFDPYHDGSVKYFKEIGVWTPELEEFQQEQLDLQAKRKVAWQEAIKAAAEKKLKFEDPKWYNAIDGFWVEWLRARNLISIPKVKYTESKK